MAPRISFETGSRGAGGPRSAGGGPGASRGRWCRLPGLPLGLVVRERLVSGHLDLAAGHVHVVIHVVTHSDTVAAAGVVRVDV